MSRMKQVEISLSEGEVRALGQIIKATNLSQKSICTMAYVNAGWLSKLLDTKNFNGDETEGDRGKCTTKVARDGPLRKLVTYLQGVLNNQAVTIETAAREAFSQLATRLNCSAAETRRIAPYYPGQPVTDGSLNYVRRRSWDPVLTQELQSAPDIAIALEGPPGMGKQSTVAGLVATLRQAGIKVAHISIQPTVFYGEISIPAVLQQIAVGAIEQWGVHMHVDNVGNPYSCADLIATAAVSAGQCVLVCDGLEEIFYKRALDEATGLTEWQSPSEGLSRLTAIYSATVSVAAILGQKRASGCTVPGLIYCTERQTHPIFQRAWAFARWGSLRSFTCPLFERSESDSLIDSFARLNEGQKALIYGAFRGHPELTDLAVRGWNDHPLASIEDCENIFKCWRVGGNVTIEALLQIEATAATLNSNGRESEAAALLRNNALADPDNEPYPVCLWLAKLRKKSGA